MPAELLANVFRGGTVESVHLGHLSIIEGDGHVVSEIGDISTVTYFRSSSKAFQFIPCITSGAADAFGFSDEEIALAVASHSGEPRHVEIAASMLAKAGFSESDLRCGSHLPFNDTEAKRILSTGATASQLHNNCSGKHAGMLAFAKHIGADVENYELAENRIQKRILRCVSDFAETPESSIAVGVDGCAAPNFALPVAAMAKAFINLMLPVRFPEVTQNACSRIVSAMIKFPELIGGTERLDTMLMQAAGGKIISKVGADGVWLCGVLPGEKWPTGLGIALKVADGDDHRARPVVAVEVLRQLEILSDADLNTVAPMRIKNRRGEHVGMVSAARRFVG